MIHSLSRFFFFTGSTDARLQYLEESKRIKVSISITNVHLTVKMRSMMRLNLYTVKTKQNLSSYLHLMKWIRGTDIFSTTNEVSKEDVILVLRQEAGYIYFLFFSCISHCLMECNNALPSSKHPLVLKVHSPFISTIDFSTKTIKNITRVLFVCLFGWYSGC